MKCEKCGHEVALASTCPYCFEKVPEAKTQAHTRKGTYRGRVQKRGWFANLMDYMHNPMVLWWKKAFIILSTIYIISPIDLIPIFFPLVGLLDDLILLIILIRFIQRELADYNG